MSDDATRLEAIKHLLWELRNTPQSTMPKVDDEAGWQQISDRVNALLGEVERIAGVPNLPPRFRG